MKIDRDDFYPYQILCLFCFKILFFWLFANCWPESVTLYTGVWFTRPIILAYPAPCAIPDCNPGPFTWIQFFMAVPAFHQ